MTHCHVSPIRPILSGLEDVPALAKPCSAMSETSSNCWKISVINAAGCWEHLVGRAPRTSGMAA